MPENSESPTLMRLSQAAEYLQMSPSTLRQYIIVGLFPEPKHRRTHWRMKPSRYFTVEELEEYKRILASLPPGEITRRMRERYPQKKDPNWE